MKLTNNRKGLSMNKLNAALPLLQIVSDSHGPSYDFSQEAREMIQIGFIQGLKATLDDWSEEVAFPTRIEKAVLGNLRHACTDASKVDCCLALAKKDVDAVVWNNKERERAKTQF